MSVSVSQFVGVVGLALFISAAGCGGDDDSMKPSASSDSDVSLRQAGEREFREYISLITDEDWEALWSHLYPAHKEAVPQEQFVACFESQSVELTSLEITNVSEQGITIPATDEHDATVALSVEIDWMIDNESYQQNQVVNMLPVSGEWHWLLAQPADYAGGSCPDDPLPQMF